MTQLGIFSWFGYQLPLAERFRLIKEAGFSATSLWLNFEGDRFDQVPHNEKPELARQHGLSIDNVHASYSHCNLLWSDSQAERDKIITQYRESVSYCRRYQIPVLVIHLSQSDTPPPMRQEGFAALGELVKYAEDSGVMLAVENTRKPEYLYALFEYSDSPALGLCYDSSHDALWGQPPGAVLTKWGERLVTTHFSDNKGERDDHWLPGDGNIDWEQLGACFPVNTYSGIIHLEVTPLSAETMPAQTFLQQAYQQAERLSILLKKMEI